MSRSFRPVFAPLALAVISALVACGGGGGSSAGAPTPPAPAATGLAGQVAVGVAITQGKLRIVDADGVEIAHDIAIGTDGSYSVPTVTGKAPYRLEACGFAGADYLCITSVAQALGTANVTPLTHAAVLLATGRTPDAVMSGVASDLSASSVSSAQTQLRNGLSGVMSGNVPAGFDFVTGDLTAGSRNGYDRVLDSIGVATGTDGSAFVQITPRVGTGNLYLQAGSSAGTLVVDPAAASLPLSSLDALFAQMTTAVGSAQACSSGMAAAMASNARLAFEGVLNGPTEVAGALCGLFAEQGLWGARLASPTLGRCDLSGAAAVCRVSFVIDAGEGGRQSVSNGLGVVREGNVWKFLGSADPLHMDASARAQRSRRVDGATPVDRYERAIAVEIQAAEGLRCAKVEQRDSNGSRVTVAYFKPFGAGVQRLSAWRDGNGERSFNPASGQMRSGDDSWLMLPEGAAGDAVVRNFFRGGRTLVVSTYGDANCATPLAFGSRSEFEIDIDGVPPVWEAMPSLPWPELSSGTVEAMSSLTLAANASAQLNVAWTFAHGRGGVSEMMFCGDQSACGEGEAGRLGTRDFSPALSSTTISLQNGATALGRTRMLSLSGSGPDGIHMQANFTVCPDSASGQACY